MESLNSDNSDILSSQPSDAKVSENNSSSLVIMDLGKASKKRIKGLKRGEGKLLSKVNDALQMANINASPEKEVVTLVLLIEKKKKKKTLNLLKPFL